MKSCLGILVALVATSEAFMPTGSSHRYKSTTTLLKAVHREEGRDNKKHWLGPAVTAVASFTLASQIAFASVPVGTVQTPGRSIQGWLRRESGRSG